MKVEEFKKKFEETSKKFYNKALQDFDGKNFQDLVKYAWGIKDYTEISVDLKGKTDLTEQEIFEELYKAKETLSKNDVPQPKYDKDRFFIYGWAYVNEAKIKKDFTEKYGSLKKGLEEAFKDWARYNGGTEYSRFSTMKWLIIMHLGEKKFHEFEEKYPVTAYNCEWFINN